MMNPESNSLSDRALKELTFYPSRREDILAAFREEKPEADSTVFCTLSSGDNVTELQVAVAYAEAANKISNRASELLSGNTSVTSLKLQRDELFTRVEVKPNKLKTSLHNLRWYKIKLQIADTKIAESIIKIASGDDPIGLDIRAHNFAIMLLEVEERALNLKEKVKSQQESLNRRAHLYHQAREMARQGIVVPGFEDICTTEADNVFINILESQLNETGYIPQLRVINDVDKNLTPHEDSVLKPGNTIGRLVDHLDKSFKSNFRLRLPLTDFAADDPANPDRLLATELLEQAGKITHPVFLDAVTAAKLAHETKAEFRVLTSNMAAYGRGVAKNLGHSEEIVVEGLKADSIMAQEKPLRLMEMILEDPEAVILFSDDRDRRTCEAIEAGSAIEGLEIPLPLEDMVMFASRVAGEGETKDFKLAATLKENGIAFAENHKDGQEGYQGVVKMMQIYQRWREQRLVEGWPETKAEAEAQAYFHNIIKNAQSAYENYIRILEIERERLLGFVDSQIVKEVEQVTGNNHLLLVQTLVRKLEESDSIHHKQLSLVKRKLEILEKTEGSGINLLLKANEIYTKSVESIPENSPKRAVIAVKAYRQAMAEIVKQKENALIEPLATPPPDLVRLRLIGHDLIADINLGELNQTSLPLVFEQPIVNFAFSNTAARYVLVRFTDGINSHGLPNDYSLVIERPNESKHKLAPINGRVVLDGRGQLIFPELAATHLDQVNHLTKTLHEYIRIALIYYRNPFKPAGGLEKVLREQGKALKKLGFKVRFIGGNPPSEEYGKELLDQFEHKVIKGAHERDADIIAMANELYQGNIPTGYKIHVQMLKEQLIDALADVDHGIIHNPLFPRNPAFTEAVISLYISGKLSLKSLIGWVHDIGLEVETPRYHDMEGNSPWTWVGKRQPGVRYVAVSQPVAEKLDKQPLFSPADPISSAKSIFITHGSDYEAMQPDNELTKFLRSKINWGKIDQVWVNPGRIAHRKGTIEAITAVACLKSAALIITGAPHFTQTGSTRYIDDPYYEITRALVRQLGIEDRIIFLFDSFGEIPDGVFERYVGQLYKTYDGVLSLPFAEGFGIEMLNAITENSNLVISDDPALKSNVGDSANYIPIGTHPIIPAVTMTAVLANDRGYSIRHESRTTRNWTAKAKQMLPLLGTEFKIKDIQLEE